MIKTILILSASLIFAGLAINGCDSPEKKVENAQNKVNEASNNLDSANRQYLAQIESYKKETNIKIEANAKSLADFKARVAHDKQDAKNDYHNKIAALEQKNSDLKLKLDDYKSESKENWEHFKKGFDADMDKVGTSIKDFTNKVTN
jgi:hypothetical protein